MRTCGLRWGIVLGLVLPLLAGIVPVQKWDSGRWPTDEFTAPYWWLTAPMIAVVVYALVAGWRALIAVCAIGMTLWGTLAIWAVASPSHITWDDSRGGGYVESGPAAGLLLVIAGGAVLAAMTVMVLRVRPGAREQGRSGPGMKLALALAGALGIAAMCWPLALSRGEVWDSMWTSRTGDILPGPWLVAIFVVWAVAVVRPGHRALAGVGAAMFATCAVAAAMRGLEFWLEPNAYAPSYAVGLGTWLALASAAIAALAALGTAIAVAWTLRRTPG